MIKTRRIKKSNKTRSKKKNKRSFWVMTKTRRQ